MLENEEGLCHECPPRMQAPLNIKQDNNSLVCESQDVPHACILRRIDSIQATLARMVTILNSDPEQKVQP